MLGSSIPFEEFRNLQGIHQSLWSYADTAAGVWPRSLSRLEISLGARTLFFLYADLFINFILLMIMMEPFDDGTL